MFQMAFAIITPAVITGSCADRMKFSAMLVFFTLWSLLVYAPLAHWVWSPTGWLATLGFADFAGGTVVEINCGVTGLVCALMLGRRIGYGSENMAPWNLSYAVIGASLLWVGWMGFNSGGAMGANGRAGMAVLVTQISAAGATLAWSFAEWFLRGKPSVLGAISGAVAGLVAITPAAGFVLPGPALIIGVIAGFVCYWASTSLKAALRYDDSLDAFGVHGIGGIIGTLATGWFAYGKLTATAAAPKGVYVGGARAVGDASDRCRRDHRLCRAGELDPVDDHTTAWSACGSASDDEREGLDIALHGEQVF